MDNFLFISTFLLTTLTYGQVQNSHELFGRPFPNEEVLTLSPYDVDAYGHDQHNKVHTLQGGSWLDLTLVGTWPLNDYSIHCVTWDKETGGVKVVGQSDMHIKATSYSNKRENVKHVFSHNLQFDTFDFTQKESMKNATISNCIFDYFDKINSLDEPFGRRVNLEFSANPLYPRTDYSSLRSNRTDRSPEFLMLGRRKNRTRPYLVQMYHLSDDMIAAGEAFLTTINGRRRMNTGLVVGVMNTSEIENVDTYGLRERAVVHRKKQIYTKPKFRNFHPSALISIKLDWIVQSSREPELNMLLDGTINF